MADTGLATQTAATATAGMEMAAIIPAIPWMRRIEEHTAWSVLSRLPVTMAAEISLSRFRVRDLLGLAAGQVFETDSPDTEDVPLKVSGVQLGWTEFEVVEQQICSSVDTAGLAVFTE